MSSPVRSSATRPEIEIPLSQVAKFLRQLIHDLRNHLNAIELQSAFLGEIANSAESKEEVQRLRATVSQLNSDLQKVSTALSAPHLGKVPYLAADLVEDLRELLRKNYPKESARVKWDKKAKETRLEIDPALLISALTELFQNAFLHNASDGPIQVQLAVEKSAFLIKISEHQQGFNGSTEAWGQEPFQSIKKGHYGLGLHRSRNIIEAHGGQLQAHYDSPSSLLITTVALPVAE